MTHPKESPFAPREELFAARKGAALRELARIRAEVEAYGDDGRISWGHAGSMGNVADRLAEVRLVEAGK